ncbi:putative class III chitinase [Thermoascus aurantiacus ATCC 26904]
MASSKNFVSLAAFLAATRGAYAALDTSSSTNVAVYWGQNSYMQSSGDLAQQRLSYYCQNTDIDVFQLAFLTVINGPGGAPEINFANQGNDCTVFPGTALLNCPQIGEDIKTCQSLGKTILLSIGGATYSEGGFSSEDAAVAGANMIWETFGPQQPGSSAYRPFGDAVVDGFDFDFEATVNNMVPFANTLRSLMDADTSKKYYLTAAPQCPYPDAADGAMLDGAVSFDAIWVQFYNNYCGLQSFVPGSSTQNNFNFATWDNWAKTTSKNPNVKVFLGVPANTGAAGSGYEAPSSLTPIINYCKTFSSFGGVMMWDASQAYANNGFIPAVKQALTTTASRIMRRLFPSY